MLGANKVLLKWCEQRQSFDTSFLSNVGIQWSSSCPRFSSWYQCCAALGLQTDLIMIIILVSIQCTLDISKHPLRWRHNDHAGVSNHQPHGCLLNRLFRRKSKKTSKLRVTGLCAGNSPGTGEFPAQMASYAENVCIWWRHHVISPKNSGKTSHSSPIRTVVVLCESIAWTMF